MSQESKAIRTKIDDLPEVAGEMSAEALDEVAGGLLSRGGLAGGAAVRACATSAGTCTFCNDTDCNPD